MERTTIDTQRRSILFQLNEHRQRERKREGESESEIKILPLHANV